MPAAPLFSIPLADLESDEKDLDEPIPLAWLEAAFAETEAVPRGAGRLEVTVSKTGREVMVRGTATASVTVPCARTLDPVDYDLRAEVFLLLSPRSSAGGPGGPRPRRTAASGPAEARPRKKGQRPEPGVKPGAAPSKGHEKPRGKRKEEEAELAEKDAAHDSYDGDRVVLDPFLREFLLLELPMFPLREDLRSEATPAIDPPPDDPAEAGRTAETVDPRLAPLAALKNRLREKKE